MRSVLIGRYVTYLGNVAKKFLWGNGKTNERALIYALPPRSDLRAGYSTHARARYIPVSPSEKT